MIPDPRIGRPYNITHHALLDHRRVTRSRSTGVEGGFAQANHGKSSPLKRMRPGDWVIYYSSKEHFGEDEKCQRFTAIGQVKPDDVYTARMGSSFTSNRRDVDYMPCVEMSILLLIDKLSFIKDKEHWGVPFRFGVLEIPHEDFAQIARTMNVEQTA